MIRVGVAYALMGAVLAAVAVASARDRTNPRRHGHAAFWGLFAVSFLLGGRLGDLGNGVLVLAMVGIAGFGGLRSGAGAAARPVSVEAGVARWGSWLFLPLLIVPAIALAGTLGFGLLTLQGAPLVDPKQVTVISIALGVVLALATAMIMLRPGPAAPVHEARRLFDAIGPAAILPQLLAALGAVFVLAGLGSAVGDLIGRWLPVGSRLAAVTTFCLGMAAFTVVMGNAFAAFPVLTAGVGAPLLVHRFGADPAAVGALGMLAGYCGTLLTPMAAHNIIPTALLELPNGAVIRAQAPTAVLLLLGNILLMYVLAFPR